MGSNALQSKYSYIFFGRSSTWKGGVPATDENIGFNPIVNSTDIANLVQKFETAVTCGSNDPDMEWEGPLGPADMTIRALFRDPLTLLCYFTNKEVPAEWSGTDDEITANFSSQVDIDNNIWIQIHVHDGSGSVKHLNFLLDGGRITSYKWIIEAGKPMYEEITFKFSEVTATANAPDIDDGFDDAKFNRTGVLQVSTIIAKQASDIGDGDYFTMQGISAALVRTDYYVWFDKAGDESADPAPSGYTSIKCDISADTTAQTVSDCITAAIHGVGNFTAANGAGASTTITVTNAHKGDCLKIVDVDSTLTLATTVDGIVDIDGGYSNWDGAYAANRVVQSNDVTITVGGASILGIHLKKATLTIPWAISMEHIQGSNVADILTEGSRGPYTATFAGTYKGNDLVSEFMNSLTSKTKVTVKFEYATNKYLQVTNLVPEKSNPIAQLPENRPINVTFNYKNGAAPVATYYWKGSEANDPSNHITHHTP